MKRQFDWSWYDHIEGEWYLYGKRLKVPVIISKKTISLMHDIQKRASPTGGDDSRRAGVDRNGGEGAWVS